MIKGTIALDIDGTLTDKTHLIPDDVTLYLESLVKDGWEVILVTGRILSYALNAIEKFTFPHFLILQNGADTLKMPEKILIDQNYLDKTALQETIDLYKDCKEDFLIYSGFEKGDFCYYRPNHFSKDYLNYLVKVERLSAEPWKEVESFDEIKQENFPLFKCLGPLEDLEAVQRKISRSLYSSIIADPISDGLYNLLLITQANAAKGKSLLKLIKKMQFRRPLIAAGDDNNDIPLLQIADQKIAMAKAPAQLKKEANIVTHSIIAGLEQALEQAYE